MRTTTWLSRMLLCRGASFSAEGLRDRLFRERAHDVVAGVVWKQAVCRQGLLEIAAVGQRRVVVQIDRAAPRRNLPDRAIQTGDLSLRPPRGLVDEAVAHRRD